MYEQWDTSASRKHNADYRDIQLKPETYIEWSIEWSIALTEKTCLVRVLLMFATHHPVLNASQGLLVQ